MKRILSIILCLALLVTLAATAITANAVATSADPSGATSQSNSSRATLSGPSDFSWDNASVYFLLTDRFYNGNTSNDHSYGRSLDQNGQVVTGNSDAASFHGGDFAGITKKIEEGYFDNLGVNAIWISAPYEQIHGYCIAGNGKSGSFPHYSYHGYYALDFSQTDQNFGTEEEFETLVDTAHKHNIRVVLDIVMNHVGYNTLYDMDEYGFGTVKSGWENDYYNAKLNDQSYHTYIDYNNNAADWAKWWGPDWLRAGLAGYREGSGDLEGCQAFLPDLKENVNATVDIPQILKTKWTKEGTLVQKQSELNSYFATGKQKTVRNYLVFWLSQWVEKYGVDGFRCDTAKHVSMDSWKALKTQCVESLKTWRANNPSKPGADWDEDFWMTGECYPHFLSYDGFYTQGGFDSMINFSFGSSNSFDAGAPGVPGASSINETYRSYANQLNSNDKFNVLSYLSSHDTRLCRNDLIYQGSAFQLLPGGIQIYYGDETNRPLLGGLASGKDHALRSDMNWSNLDNSVLSHWQKVGQFRNNHVAVGAGQHTNLSATSGTAFARTYNKNGVADAVVACIGANKNTSVTITLNNTFPDGTVLKNTYDGTTAAVSGGKVTFSSGANGTILLESSDGTVPTTPSTQPTTATTPTKPTAPTKPTTPTQPATEIVGIYGDANVDKTVDINDTTAIQKHIADITALSETGYILSDVDVNGSVNIKDASYIQKKLVGLSDIAKVGQTLIKQAPTQPTQATQPQEDGTVVYFENTENWPQVYIYYWTTGSEGPNAWPGVSMEQTSDGKWKYTIPTGFDKVIFSKGSNEGQTGNLTVPSTSGMTFNFSSNSWS